MEDKGQNKIIAFDTLFTNNHIQMLKIFLAYLPPVTQNKLAVYIKFLELQYTLDFLKRFPLSENHTVTQEQHFAKNEVYEELFPFCNPSEQNVLQNMRNMVKNLENMQEILHMMNMFQEMSQSSDDSWDFLSGLSALTDLPDLSGLDINQLLQLFQ